MVSKIPLRHSPFLFITYFSILIFVGLMGTAYWCLFLFSDKDVEAYRMLVENANTKTAKLSNNLHKASQKHRGTHKDIWFTKGHDRLHVRLLSEDVELVLAQEEEQTEVIEHMKNVTCFMQEELFYLLPDGREVVTRANGELAFRQKNASHEVVNFSGAPKDLIPMQIVRYFQADKATYYYQKDRLEADKVKICQFKTPGHALIASKEGLNPLMSGLASKVECSFLDDHYNFKAHGLKANFSSFKKR